MDPNTVTAAATVTIAAFTVVLAIVSTCQSRLTRQAIKLGHQDFIATHRPQIVARSFESVLDPDAGNADIIAVRFAYANNGVTLAKILEVGSKITNTSDPGVNFSVRKPESPVMLMSGDPHQVEWVKSTYRYSDITPTSAIYCIGYILYADRLGRLRRTGFCRKFNPENRRWVRQTQSEYEFQD